MYFKKCNKNCLDLHCLMQLIGGKTQANRAYMINALKVFALYPTWCTDIMLSLMYLENTA